MVVLDEMGESFPRRKLQTAHNLPRLAVSSSAPHLQEARVRTVSVKMNVRHRARTVQPFSSHGAFHLDTPETSRPLDLQLPRLGGSKSLSCLVMNANHRLRDQQLKLQRVDQLAPISISRPTTSYDAGDSDAQAAESLMDGIGHLFAQSAAVYATSKKPLTAAEEEEAKLQQAREQEAAEREKQELRRLELQRQVAANNMVKSAVRRGILEKLEELRGDREAQDKFEAYIRSIRPRPEQHKVRENMRNVTEVTAAEYAREVLSRQAARRDEQGRRQVKAKRDCEERAEERYRTLMNKIHAKHDSHEQGMQRQMALGAAQAALLPSLAWLTVSQMTRSATVLGGALRAGRERREQRLLELRAVAVLQRQFRLMIFRKRFHSLRRLLDTMRRIVWYWRFKRRIRQKTAAYYKLLDFLSAHRLALSAVQLQIKRFVYQVRVVQRAWRLYWVQLLAQIVVANAHWSKVERRINMRRSQAGQGPTAALNQGVKLIVLREDLRRRKRQHVGTCLEWRQYIATWEQEWQREELKLDAIAMLAATPAPAAQTTPALGGGQEEIARRLDEDAERRRVRLAKMKPPPPPKVLTEEEEAEERRLACLLALEKRGLVPPGPRPLFTLFATEEELALLGSKVRAKMGLDKRQASSGRLDVELSGGQPSGTLSRGRSLSGGLSAEVSQRNLLYPPEISRLL